MGGGVREREESEWHGDSWPEHMDVETNGRKLPVGNSQSHFLKGGYSIQDKMKKFGKCVLSSDMEPRDGEQGWPVGRGDPRYFCHLCCHGWTTVRAASVMTEDPGPARGGRGPREEAAHHHTMCL